MNELSLVVFPIIRAVCKPLLLFLHAPAILSGEDEENINAAKLNPTSKIFKKKHSGFSCFKSFQNTFQRKIESRVLRLDFQSARRTLHKIRLLCELKISYSRFCRLPPVSF